MNHDPFTHNVASNGLAEQSNFDRKVRCFPLGLELNFYRIITQGQLDSIGDACAAILAQVEGDKNFKAAVFKRGGLAPNELVRR